MASASKSQEMFALDATFVDQCLLCGSQLQHQECAYGVRKGPSWVALLLPVNHHAALPPIAAQSPF